MTAFSHGTLKTVLLAATMLASPLGAAMVTPAAAEAAITLSVQIAPPVLPDYDQPPIPEAGYIWTPGYWLWREEDAGYYWVPGTWVLPPIAGVLWTPPYWAWDNGAYLFHDGYWGTTVGFYGGVNYGFGYGGEGYEGGRWEGGRFAYNSTVNNFGAVHVTNVYVKTVTVSSRTKVSYVGGTGGIKAEPTAAQRQAEHDHHVAPTAAQTGHVAAAAKDPTLAASHNNGHPTVAATVHPVDPKTPVGGSPKPAAIERPADHAVADPAKHVVAPHPAKAEATQPARERAVEPHAAVEHSAPAHAPAAAKGDEKKPL